MDGNTLFVQYDYQDGASGGVAKYVRLSQVTYPNGRAVHYGYGTTQAIDDIMSRLATIGDGTNIHAAYKYLGAGQIVEEDYEDIDVKLSYLDGSGNVTGLDRFGRVVDQVWKNYGASETLDEYTYGYDRAGNRTSRVNGLNHDFDESYLYDLIDRLISAKRDNGFDQSWGLDGLGNFSSFDDDGTSQTRTANAVNEITAISGGWITPSYDDAGNMISGPKPGDGTTRVHYIFDAWNHLVGVREDDAGEPGDLIAEYAYDGTNRRIEKEVAGTSHVHYFYNHEWQLLEERFVDGQGATTAVNQYVWSPRYIDAPIVRFHDGNADGDLLDAGDNIRYYTGDANYNVTATIDAVTGDVVERYAYTAYGTVTVYDAAWSNPAAAAEDGPLYCGYFFDAETVLYQVRNRYYDSSLSTFISRDPIGGISLSRYVGDSPLMRVDPFGLQWIGPDPDSTRILVPIDLRWTSWRYIWILQGSFQIYGVKEEWIEIRRLSGSNSSCTTKTIPYKYRTGHWFKYTWDFEDTESGWPDPNPFADRNAAQHMADAIVSQMISQYSLPTNQNWETRDSSIAVPPCTRRTVAIEQLVITWNAEGHATLFSGPRWPWIGMGDEWQEHGHLHLEGQGKARGGIREREVSSERIANCCCD